MKSGSLTQGMGILTERHPCFSNSTKSLSTSISSYSAHSNVKKDGHDNISTLPTKKNQYQNEFKHHKINSSHRLNNMSMNKTISSNHSSIEDEAANAVASILQNGGSFESAVKTVKNILISNAKENIMTHKVASNVKREFFATAWSGEESLNVDNSSRLSNTSRRSTDLAQYWAMTSVHVVSAILATGGNSSAAHAAASSVLITGRKCMEDGKNLKEATHTAAIEASKKVRLSGGSEEAATAATVAIIENSILNENSKKSSIEAKKNVESNESIVHGNFQNHPGRRNDGLFQSNQKLDLYYQRLERLRNEMKNKKLKRSIIEADLFDKYNSNINERRKLLDKFTQILQLTVFEARQEIKEKKIIEKFQILENEAVKLSERIETHQYSEGGTSKHGKKEVDFMKKISELLKKKFTLQQQKAADENLRNNPTIDKNDFLSDSFSYNSLPSNSLCSSKNTSMDKIKRVRQNKGKEKIRREQDQHASQNDSGCEYESASFDESYQSDLHRAETNDSLKKAEREEEQSAARIETMKKFWNGTFLVASEISKAAGSCLWLSYEAGTALVDVGCSQVTQMEEEEKKKKKEKKDDRSDDNTSLTDESGNDDLTSFRQSTDASSSMEEDEEDETRYSSRENPKPENQEPVEYIDTEEEKNQYSTIHENAIRSQKQFPTRHLNGQAPGNRLKYGVTLAPKSNEVSFLMREVETLLSKDVPFAKSQIKSSLANPYSSSIMTRSIPRKSSTRSATKKDALGSPPKRRNFMNLNISSHRSPIGSPLNNSEHGNRSISSTSIIQYDNNRTPNDPTKPFSKYSLVAGRARNIGSPPPTSGIAFYNKNRDMSNKEAMNSPTKAVGKMKDKMWGIWKKK